jgi:hypothetical protein
MGFLPDIGRTSVVEGGLIDSVFAMTILKRFLLS